MKKRGKGVPSRFPLSLFGIYLGVLLLMCGIHTGMMIGFFETGAGTAVQITFPLLYWALVAVGLTLYTRHKMIQTYEVPMQQLAEATRRVAQGDFTVRVPTIHAPDKYDYMDRMLLDFNTMVAELGSIETMKTDFIANVSHEIKTPLAVISNCAQLLQSRTISEEDRRQYVEDIIRNTRRMADLVTNILKLNKLENQVIKPQETIYDLCAQLADCALMFEDNWERKNIDFTFETEDRVQIRGDREMLELVWNNLLSNALKFTPEDGRVSLRQTSDAGYVTVTVSDTGCGMDEATMKHIFDKFYQGDTSHATAGNGLGLALVQRVLHLAGGNVTVESAPGEGSTFTVRLPLKENAGVD